VYRDLGGLSHKLFLLQEDDDRCTGTCFNLVAFWSQIFYCGRMTICVPGLGWIESQIIFIAGG